MIDPLSLVGLILTMVQLIAKEAETARQNKKKCLDLAERARTLANVLPSYEYPAVKDEDTERVLRRLKEALDETLTLIQSCQTVSICSRNRKAAELDGVNGKINDCIRDLNFIRNARTNQVAAASSVPAQTYDHGSYNQYQAQGGGGASSSACVGYPPPQYAPVNVHWTPAPSPYHASPAPSASGYNLSSLYTLPTINKVFDNSMNDKSFICSNFRMCFNFEHKVFPMDTSVFPAKGDM
ncbi:hypothetical protein D1007_12653 [Hordeum vulgare]|nr:hypothetical protein D1007_12653 [Hordeum vulgare]